MEQYILKTTLEDGTVLVSSKFTNKAFKTIKTNGLMNIKSGGNQQADDMVKAIENSDGAIKIMFEKPFMDYCEIKKLPAKERDINALLDNLIPKDLMQMRGQIIKWYIEALSEMTDIVKNTEAPENTENAILEEKTAAN